MAEAVVLINTKIESPQDPVFGNLKEIDGVDKAYTTRHGVYDFVVKVRTKTMNKLRNVVLEHIQKIDAVESTTTLLVAQK